MTIRQTAAAIGLSMIASATIAGQTTSTESIDRAESAWRAAGMTEYVITLRVSCFCPVGPGPRSFHVKDGVVESLGPQNGAPRDVYDSYNTVEKLFAAIRRAAAASPFHLVTQFQSPLGYPVSADIDPQERVADDELRFQVFDLRAGSQPPTRIAVPSVVTRPASPLAIRDVRMDELVTEVPAIAENGRCETSHIPSPEPNGKTLMYAFGPERATRRLAVFLDADGKAVRYSDGRGDLRGAGDSSVTPQNPLGRITLIAVDFVRQSAVVRNENGNAPSNAARARGPEVLNAPNLGKPADMAAFIRTQCDR